VTGSVTSKVRRDTDARIKTGIPINIVRIAAQGNKFFIKDICRCRMEQIVESLFYSDIHKRKRR
jgi:hypothetical protein